MAWFYEIRDSDNGVMKRDGGFSTQNAAKIAALADAKKMKSFRVRHALNCRVPNPCAVCKGAGFGQRTGSIPGLVPFGKRGS
jgi:hypothetical protein